MRRSTLHSQTAGGVFLNWANAAEASTDVPTTAPAPSHANLVANFMFDRPIDYLV
jgi:hypothetical protein